MIELAKAISTFGHPGQVQPSEQLITLTLGQLREIVSLAIKEATAPILQEVHALRGRVVALESRISSTGILQDPKGEIQVIGAILQTRDEEVSALKAELAALEEATAKERAYDRQRLAKLEHREPNPTPKTLAHVDELHVMMRHESHPPLSLARAARLLGLSKSGMKHLLPLVRQDTRFDVTRDPHHKQRLLIKLRKFRGS